MATDSTTNWCYISKEYMKNLDRTDLVRIHCPHERTQEIWL